jgi:hypothetical protein
VPAALRVPSNLLRIVCEFQKGSRETMLHIPSRRLRKQRGERHAEKMQGYRKRSLLRGKLGDERARRPGLGTRANGCCNPKRARQQISADPIHSEKLRKIINYKIKISWPNAKQPKTGLLSYYPNFPSSRDETQSWRSRRIMVCVGVRRATDGDRLHNVEASP